MILGIGLYSIITATVTNSLIVGNRSEPADVAGQIERLSALHAEGRVTDDEYRAAKAVVLT